MSKPKPDTKHLQQKPSGLWQFIWRVPSDCRDAFDGKQYVKRSLETHSLREAKARRALMLAECMRVVQEARSAGAGDEKAMFKAHVRDLKNATQAELNSAWDAYEHIKGETPDERAWRAAMQAVYLGHNPELAKCSLRDALRLYLEEKESKLKRNTITTVTKAVDTFLDHMHKADISLESITRPDVRKFIKGSPLAGKTIGTRLTFLSGVFQAAQDHGEIDAGAPNPFARHKVGTGTAQSFQPFTKDELRKIFDATAQYRESPKDYHKFLLPRLAYATGCRLEELASLQRAQIREEGDTLYIAIAAGVDSYRGKTLNAGRRIPIHSTLADEVKHWRDSDTHTLIFPALESKRADGKLGDKFGKWFGRLKKELGIPGGRHKGFHSFRVHMATNLEKADVPENRAVWIMGHTRNLSLSYGLYSQGPSLEQLSVDVEAAVGQGIKTELGGNW